jgi:hypothetical protein
MPQEPLTPATLLAIARATDLPIGSEADAARIAAGAQTVIDAVRQMQHLELFDTEPADYLPALEQLARLEEPAP